MASARPQRTNAPMPLTTALTAMSVGYGMRSVRCPMTIWPMKAEALKRERTIVDVNWLDSARVNIAM